LAFAVLYKEPKALIIVGTSCKLAPAKGVCVTRASEGGEWSDVSGQFSVYCD